MKTEDLEELALVHYMSGGTSDGLGDMAAGALSVGIFYYLIQALIGLGCAMFSIFSYLIAFVIVSCRYIKGVVKCQKERK